MTKHPEQAPAFMVFDVESIGLHGEGFAVGWVVIDKDGSTIEECYMYCSPETAWGSGENRKWVAENVPSIRINCLSPYYVRKGFWEAWIKWRDAGALLLADCAWPVEARFLFACIEDKPHQREWCGPYPLFDLSSMLRAHGRDPLQVHARLPNELPVHDPLADARQSARLVIELLKEVGHWPDPTIDPSRDMP